MSKKEYNQVLCKNDKYPLIVIYNEETKKLAFYCEICKNVWYFNQYLGDLFDKETMALYKGGEND